MATGSDSELSSLRRELDALGRRRERLDKRDEELAEEVKTVLGRAFGRISMSEAADRLKMHRTTVYRVYKPHG